MKKMKTKTKMKKKSVLDDPVVREVREARASLWREGGGTIEGYIRAVHEIVEGTQPRPRSRRKSET
jgi:hypothetical protein